jgi:DNA-binding NtrC family response regulator
VPLEDAVVWLLYHRYEERLLRGMEAVLAGRDRGSTFAFYRSFRQDHVRLLEALGLAPPAEGDTAHLFACFFQVRRAFHHIIRFIVGGTMVAARLRAAVWQSIFSHDMRRYRRALYDRMSDFSTLVTGPSGSGKELVAQAIGLSRYVPFDPVKGIFTSDFVGSFFALNLAALAPTLIESELFGHRRGSFTGALEDRAGWLEQCPPLGTVFLDEIGELDPGLQVKLLRVLESRTFQRLGESGDRRFFGKLVAATHRDLAEAMASGAFREDLYYRLCSDLVRTPSLKEQLEESPDVLGELLVFLARRNVEGEEAQAVALEVATWIDENLGAEYTWPGNIRELEQCLRNVLIRRQYWPPAREARGIDTLLADAARRGLTADELLRLYCTWTYRAAGSYQEAARRLELDRRTVRAKVDPKLLERERQ